MPQLANDEADLVEFNQVREENTSRSKPNFQN